MDSKQLYGTRTQYRNSTWHAEDHCLLKYKPYTSGEHREGTGAG